MRGLIKNPWAIAAIMAMLALLAVLAWELVGEHCASYTYINRGIACGESQPVRKINYITLQHDISAYISAKVASSSAGEVSVYFRDLRDGPTFSINGSEAFAPASLLKLPMVFVFFTLSEDHPEILDTKLMYSRTVLSQKYEIPTQVNFDFEGEGLMEGGTYTVRELMKASIQYSDNTAYYALVDYINTQYPGGTDYALKTFQELGVIDPRTPEEETVTVRDYSSLFRLLYNASYLNAKDSEEVLSWLAASSFDAGLEAGVPKGVVVASKFGERELGEDRRLHDCGIIYYPGNPYTLCVMTQGSDWAQLKTIIGDISAMVYREVDSRAR